MQGELRRNYNERFTASVYDKMLSALRSSVGELPFRVAETPLFLSDETRDALYDAADALLAELSAPELNAAMDPIVPAAYRAPGGERLPACVTLDFAMAATEDDRIEPKLVELQAFPSLYAFTLVQSQIWLSILQELQLLDREWTSFWGDLEPESYLAAFREVVVGEEDPEHVVLLDIDPPTQKTLPDFMATQQLLGVDPVCVRAVERDGKRLYRRKHGRRVPIRRIYNRVVYDELIQRAPQMSFAYSDELDVTFVPHPNWQWTWSKAVLPRLRHPSVPAAHLVSELDAVPADLGRYVLKPLFSFAGAGVNVEPTESSVMAIPSAERSNWLLQEKINYARRLHTPDGQGVAAEVRVLCLMRPGDARPQVMSNLTRLSRGKMLGVDFNRDFDWVGSTVSFWAR